jgi:aminoglycoside phosphotransferase (APT) family kinase protein
MMSLVNPEDHWELPARRVVDAHAVEQRLGERALRIEPLTGGRANVNVRIDERRVLRIYERDRRAAGKEATLLQRDWRSFAVPRVLDTGDDFLVIEFISHSPLRYTPEDGEQLGSALAEIHSTRFDACGFLDRDLNVAEPFTDLVLALEEHAASELSKSALPVGNDLSRRVEQFVRANREALQELVAVPMLLHGDFKASNLRRAERDGALLIFDWEFAYAGAALLDVGQLFRWGASPEFAANFERCYRDGGGMLPPQWRHWAAVFDLFNLAGLLRGAAAGSRQFRDVEQRIEQTLTASRHSA